MGRVSKAIRETILVLLALGLLVGSASAYAGGWPPAVIVESSSMMHRDGEVGFGRVGTIDPGDLVLVKALDDPADVGTLVEGGTERYGMPGDVIVYRPAEGAGETPIIHRAIAYVEMAEGPVFRVRWDPAAPCVGGADKDAADAAWCIYGSEGVLLSGVPGAGDDRIVPTGNGFITKGDNPATNHDTDQAAGISRDAAGHPVLVPLERVEGKARGELPWLGLVKLAMAGEPNEAHPPASYVQVGNAFAPGDLWIMLTLSLAVVLGGPFAWDAWRARRARRRGDARAP